MPYSPVIPLNLTLPWTQITAGPSQLQYTTNWTADDVLDVVVYHRAANSTANDFLQIVSPINYTSSYIGSNFYIQVNFIPSYTVNTGDIITITRITPVDRMNLYINTNFNPTMLNEDFNRIIMMMQERVLCDNYLSLKYNNSVTLNTNDIVDNIIPYLPASDVWTKASDNSAIIAAAYNTGGGGGGSGTVISIGLSTSTLDLSGTNPVTTSGTIGVDLPPIGTIVAGAYTNTNLTVDAYGRITQITNGSGGSGNSGAMVQTITQIAHGFVVNQIVYWNGSAYALAKADTTADAEVYGMVTSVINVNSFVITLGGLITSSGLAVGVNFLSEAVAGALTTTPPTTPGSIEKPLLIATSVTSGLFVNWRGKVIPDAAPLAGSWQTVSTNTAMVSGVNYIVNSGTVAFTLPVSASVGDIMEIAGYNNTWSVHQNAGQQIQFGIKVTTPGTGGSLTSTLMGDCIRLLCTMADTNWLVLSDMGNITYV